MELWRLRGANAQTDDAELADLPRWKPWWRGAGALGCASRPSESPVASGCGQYRTGRARTRTAWPMQRLAVTVGSPRYFKRRGIPRTPHELLEHDCIRHRLNRARFFEWEFRIGGKDVTIDVRGRLVLDEMRG